MRETVIFVIFIEFLVIGIISVTFYNAVFKTLPKIPPEKTVYDLMDTALIKNSKEFLKYYDWYEILKTTMPDIKKSQIKNEILKLQENEIKYTFIPMSETLNKEKLNGMNIFFTVGKGIIDYKNRTANVKVYIYYKKDNKLLGGETKDIYLKAYFRKWKIIRHINWDLIFEDVKLKEKNLPKREYIGF